LTPPPRRLCRSLTPDSLGYHVIPCGRLAGRITDLTFDQLPPKVVEITRRLILDQLGLGDQRREPQRVWLCE
jgi:hypothetical protein